MRHEDRMNERNCGEVAKGSIQEVGGFMIFIIMLTRAEIASLDYLLYGRLYIPTSRIDAIYSTRLSQTLQASVAAISNPVSSQRRSLVYSPSQSPSQSETSFANGVDSSNVMLSLQHDTGKWCTEYTWSADDGMWGARVLHNFGRLSNETGVRTAKERVKRVDEEDAMEGGLKGRFSAGAEVYFSAKEKSGGGKYRPSPLRLCDALAH